MAKENPTPKPDKTPFEKFTDTAREIFNLSPQGVKKTIKKYPYKPAKRRKRG
jgi:hypothetical protein